MSAVRVAHDAALVLLSSLVLENDRRWGGASPGVPMARRRRAPRRALAYAVCVLDASARRLEDHRPGCDPARGDYRAGTAGRPAVRACRRSRAGHPVLDAVAGFVKRTPFLREAVEISSYRATLTETDVTLEVLAADAPGAWGLRPYFSWSTSWPSGSNAKIVAPVRSRAHRHRQGRRTHGHPDHGRGSDTLRCGGPRPRSRRPAARAHSRSVLPVLPQPV